MPPRFVFWTILIDQKPTAFRARDREDLLPALRQLSHTNKDVALKWFARGRLWNTPEEERAARTQAPRTEKRTGEWRPGGPHRDPRERFKKGAKRPWRPRPERDSRGRDDVRNSGSTGGGQPPFRPLPDQDRAARSSQAPRPDRRPEGWRPAGPAHDPRERFTKDAKRPWSPRPERDARHRDDARNAGSAGGGRPPSRPLPGQDRPAGNSRGPKPEARPEGWRPGGPSRDTRERFNKDAKGRPPWRPGAQRDPRYRDARNAGATGGGRPPFPPREGHSSTGSQGRDKGPAGGRFSGRRPDRGGWHGKQGRPANRFERPPATRDPRSGIPPALNRKDQGARRPAGFERQGKRPGADSGRPHGPSGGGTTGKPPESTPRKPGPGEDE
jgi:hypothetical protein